MVERIVKDLEGGIRDLTGYLSNICVEELRKTRKNPISVFGVMVEIQSEHLPNTNSGDLNCHVSPP
jgi:hypothetical protein